jgi:pimeloyl-ACP methyl ester carboxylesterase
MKKYVKLAVLAISSLGALVLWQLHNSPLPQEDLDFDADLETRCETFYTEDGVALKLKRYVNEGGQPILLAHGFTGNGLEFDLPHRKHNLALYLAERGYDVWISSFRGCGREPYMCEIDDWGHSVDHLAALDAPALVKGIADATGRKPIWIGHSMGGIVLYLYLLGAKMTRDTSGFKVTIDSDLAAERNRSILGGITIGSPPAFHYGGAVWLDKLLSLPFSDINSKLLIRYFDALNRISPKLPVSLMGDFVARFPRLGRVMAKKSPVATALYNTDNVDADVGYSLLRIASDNVSTRMTNQILFLSKDPDLRDYHGECNYTAGMHTITAPLFFITGTKDFVGADNVLGYGYERVASDPKRFECYADYGHTDLVMGKRVYEEVYPDILEWIEGLQAG